MKGDKRGHSSSKNGAGGAQCVKRPPAIFVGARYEFHPGGVGNGKARHPAGDYGGIFRTLRVSPRPLKGKAELP